MKLVNQISDSNIDPSLKREVELIKLSIGKEEHILELKVKYYKLISTSKVYYPKLETICPQFITTNNRRMLPDANGAISLFSTTEEGWENAMPETDFYDYLINSNAISLPVLVAGAIQNLDSPKWDWFKEEEYVEEISE